MKWNIIVNESKDPEIVCTWTEREGQTVGEIDELASEVQKRGYDFSAEEIRWKIEDLDHGYKVQQVKDGRYMFSPISVCGTYTIRFGVDAEARSFRA